MVAAYSIGRERIRGKRWTGARTMKRGMPTLARDRILRQRMCDEWQTAGP